MTCSCPDGCNGCEEIYNTVCPKVGVTQWTCKYFECSCHLKERINVTDEEIEEELRKRGRSIEPMG